MIDTIWVILAIVVLTVILIVIIVIINQNMKIFEKHGNIRNENKNYSKKEVIPQVDMPGKIIVSDSTYEVLMEEKKKRR